MYTTVPYSYHRDYCGSFFDYSSASIAEREHTESDFVGNLNRLLEKLHIAPAAHPIAISLFKRMCAPNLHFHTPVHVLSMFQFAQRMKMKLAWWEEIAIWFHAAIYVPENQQNEWASAKFLEAMMSPFISNRKLTTVVLAVHHASRPERVPKQYQLLADLNLAHFLFDRPGSTFAVASQLEELRLHHTPEQAQIMYNDYLLSLLSRGTIYQSKIFDQYEADTISFIVRYIKRSTKKYFGDEMFAPGHEKREFHNCAASPY